MADKNIDPYADVKAAAERLTKARLAAKSGAEDNDLSIEPLVQAVTPGDKAAKEANTGGVSVKGSPDRIPDEPTSDGFTDIPDEGQAAQSTKASKTAEGGK